MMKMVIVTVLVVCYVSCTGCTGMEIGGKLWVSRIDEKQESQKTHNVPLKCYLWDSCVKSDSLDAVK